MEKLQNKEEYEKEPKKAFVPPTQKLPSMNFQDPNLPKEDTLGAGSPEALAKRGRSKAIVKKKEQKAATENGPKRGQEKKRKARDDKPTEKKGKKSALTNEEFEEIIQIVLQKSLQECLDRMGSHLDFAETSCIQSVVHSESDKDPGVAFSPPIKENADEERVMTLDNTETSIFPEDKVLLEVGQPVPEHSKKKSDISVSKKRKESDENMEEIQGGQAHRQENPPETVMQGHSDVSSQQEDEECNFGQCLVWVQCSSSKCEKWRRLRRNIDPSVLPDNWSCDQNPDLKYNRCDIPEEIWTGHESDVAYASYVPGSIIWAKQYGYPWWPGMVESDPDLGEYFLFTSHLDLLPSKYHVTFFGETVSRAWISVNMLKNFQELSLKLSGMKKFKNKDYSQKLGVAIAMAHRAEQINIQDRVSKFGFWSRYNGCDNGEGQELMLSRSPSPESCLEKEEKEEEEEKKKKKKKKKGTTLPRQKSAKTQTKKIKPSGTGDGCDQTLNKKTVKKPVGIEAPIPTPTTGGKEGPRTSAPAQPGPKKKFKAPESKITAANLAEEKEATMLPKSVTPPASSGTSPSVEKEAPGPQELPIPEAASSSPEEVTANDQDPEQLVEDNREPSEQGREPEHIDGSEELLANLFEE